MSLKIAIPKETAEFERRVAASPETVKKLADLGALIMIESGAGEGASIPDESFKDAGATIAKGQDDLYKNADVILKVQAPDEKEIDRIPKNALLIALLTPYTNSELIKTLANSGVNAFSMEFF